MTSINGVVWCWKIDSSTILFIFRESGKEIEVNLKYTSIVFLDNRNPLHLTTQEKNFLRDLKQELKLN